MKMPRIGSSTFIKPHVLVVEGLDDFHVVVALLGNMQIDSVQVVDTDGVDNLPVRLKLYVKTPGWSDVRRLGVLVDSDNDPVGRLASIRAALEAAQLAVPTEPGQVFGDRPSVLYSMLPSPDSVGRLESVIIESVSQEIRPCIEGFLQCVGVENNGVSGRHEKAFVHAYIASSIEPGMKIGEAVKAGVIDISNAAFEPIRGILRMLAD